MADEAVYEVRTIAGSKAVLMRRLARGELVDEATFDSYASARYVAAVLNKALRDETAASTSGASIVDLVASGKPAMQTGQQP